MPLETPSEPDHLPRRFPLTLMHRLLGFAVLASLLLPIVVIGQAFSTTAAIAMGVVSVPALLVFAVRHYRVTTLRGAVIYRDRLEIIGKTTSVVPFGDVRHVFLQMPPLADRSACYVRLVLHTGGEFTLDAEHSSVAWFRDFARLLVSTIEEHARPGLSPGGTFDFGEVKIRSGILYLGDQAMPPRTTCELVVRQNSIRFTKPDERVVDLPLQWVSHPHLVEEWVNARNQ